MRRLFEALQAAIMDPVRQTGVLIDHVDGIVPDPDLAARNDERRQQAIAQLGDRWLLAKEYDPTPWCHACGARTRERCDCGPLAEND